MNLLYNMLLVAYYFTPIWAFLIWKYYKFGSRYSLIAIETLLLIATIWLAYNPMRLPKITDWLHWYTFFLMAYILIFFVKFGYSNLNKIVALSLWIIFIAGDWWEISVFIYDGFGWLNGYHTWTVDLWTWLSSHIHRAYVFVTLILMAKIAHVKLNFRNALLACAGTFLAFIGMYPYSTYTPQSTIVHILSLSLLIGIVVLGEPIINE